jgi:hypothetical protein
MVVRLTRSVVLRRERAGFLSLRGWIEHLLIRCPLVGNLLQKFMLGDHTFLNEQL